MSRVRSRREALRTLAFAAPGAFAAGSSLLATGLGQSSPPPDLAVIHGADAGAATRQAVAALGGMRRFVSRGDVVFVKPNIGWARVPAQAANTHPEVVRAVVELCYEAGAKLVKVADHTLDLAERCYRRSGIQAAAERAGASVELAEPSRFRVMPLRGEAIAEWEVYAGAIEADRLINVPIVKHHSLCRLTAGMKNWFGLLGGQRDRLHDRIHAAIVDLAQFFGPDLIVLDATRILVRNGPQGGSLSDVRLADTVAAGTDQVAIDALAADLLDMPPGEVEYVRTADVRGLGSMRLDRLRVLRRDL